MPEKSSSAHFPAVTYLDGNFQSGGRSRQYLLCALIRALLPRCRRLGTAFAFALRLYAVFRGCSCCICLTLWNTPRCFLNLEVVDRKVQAINGKGLALFHEIGRYRAFPVLKALDFDTHRYWLPPLLRPLYSKHSSSSTAIRRLGLETFGFGRRLYKQLR
jgi:hypothetical protein